MSLQVSGIPGGLAEILTAETLMALVIHTITVSVCVCVSTGVEWGLLFPEANGEYQSPINLNSRAARYDPSLLDTGLHPTYVVCRDREVINDGHTVRIVLRSKSGAGLRPSKIRIHQIHTTSTHRLHDLFCVQNVCQDVGL